MDLLSPNCGECKFAKLKFEGMTVNTYKCHRFPPQVQKEGINLDYFWPIVTSKDWCGEFSD